MKINSINYFSYNNLPHQNTNSAISNQDDDRPNNIKNELNVLSVLGRSQVKFTGADNNEADEFDKTFYNNISKSLELSDEDSHKFKKIVNKFLKDNNLSSTQELFSSQDNEKMLCSFIDNVAEGLNLSDEKADILENEFVKNLAVNKLSKAFEEDDSLLETFLPFAIESMKNNLVSDNLIKAFDFDEKEQQNINSYLQKLESDISPEQIAYEITDGYNLSSLEDYNYVLKTIKSRDKLFTDFISEDDSEND